MKVVSPLSIVIASMFVYMFVCILLIWRKERKSRRRQESEMEMQENGVLAAGDVAASETTSP